MKDKTIIQKNTKIEGEIYSNEEIIVKGFIKGLIESDNDLQIYNSGRIKGDVKIQNCYTNGIFVGNIETEGQFITDKDSLTVGNIFTKSLKVNNGAKLKCNISMDEELHIESPFVYEEDEYEIPIDTEEDVVTTMDISPLPETTSETPSESAPSALENAPTALENPITALENETVSEQTHPVLVENQNTPPTEGIEGNESESTDEINEIITAGFNPPPQEDAPPPQEDNTPPQEDTTSSQEDNVTTMDISPLPETTNETPSEQTHPVLAFSQNTPPTEGIEGNENESTAVTNEIITAGFNPPPQEDAPSSQEDTMTTMDISPLQETTNETPSEQTHPVLAFSQNTPPTEGIEGNESESTAVTNEIITAGFNPPPQEDAPPPQEDAPPPQEDTTPPQENLPSPQEDNVTTMDISPLPETTNETPSEQTEEGQTHRSDLPEDATNDEITADHNEPSHSIEQNDITILYNMPVNGFIGENMKVEDVNILATAEVTSIKIEENTHIDKQVEVNFLKGIVPNKKNSVIRLFFINYANDFTGWGVHLWGIDKNKNYIIITDWDKPIVFEKFDETKAYLDISLENLKNCEQIWFIIHKGDEKTEDMYFRNFKKKKEFTYSYIDKKIY